jgi:hypothetical protein
MNFYDLFGSISVCNRQPFGPDISRATSHVYDEKEVRAARYQLRPRDLERFIKRLVGPHIADRSTLSEIMDSKS